MFSISRLPYMKMRSSIDGESAVSCVFSNTLVEKVLPEHILRIYASIFLMFIQVFLVVKTLVKTFPSRSKALSWCILHYPDYALIIFIKY